jgi:hypothetical protein
MAEESAIEGGGLHDISELWPIILETTTDLIHTVFTWYRSFLHANIKAVLLQQDSDKVIMMGALNISLRPRLSLWSENRTAYSQKHTPLISHVTHFLFFYHYYYFC